MGIGRDGNENEVKKGKGAESQKKELGISADDTRVVGQELMSTHWLQLEGWRLHPWAVVIHGEEKSRCRCYRTTPAM